MIAVAGNTDLRLEAETLPSTSATLRDKPIANADNVLSICAGLKPLLEEIVDELGKRTVPYSEHDPGYQRDPEGVLRSRNICHYANTTLGYLLSMQGFDVCRVKTSSLHGKYPYLALEHELLEIPAADPIAVDGAWYQFVKILGLNAELMPKEDILVVAHSGLDAKMEELAELRKLNPSRFLQYKITMINRFELEAEETAAYFAKIWDNRRSDHKMTKPDYFPNSLAAFLNGKTGKISGGELWALEALQKRGLLSAN
jgi:hypothetical protein